ncbi:F-box protein SKIP23-like [Rhododendron vialii]|uniref:F-box protein SKIP23-like n=1 Tax=Rhododendron vialii TaxID=182163 RepID=UPI00265E9AA3|nr:F-box protein SKIP23-like [Rhododendron vialii]
MHPLVEKAVFLTDCRSDSNDLIVVVIYNKGDVGVLRLGDERWKPLVEYQGKSYRDLINFKGKIYANISEFSAPLKFPVGDKKYLVESCGELWLLDREWRTQSDNVWYYPEANIVLAELAWYEKVIWFNVYKLDEEEHKWVEVPDLGNRILFADRDRSFSVSAADFAGDNCKGNCVFFLNSCSIYDKNYHDDNDALRGLGGKEPEIYLVGDHCVDQLVAYPGYADQFWPLPSWLATVSSSSSQS